MNITREQLSANIDGYQQIASSGAFAVLEKYYYDSFLQTAHGQSLQQMGETYIYQSGAMSVFRLIRDLAEGLGEVVPEALEEEVLEDDTNSLLD